MNAINIPAIVRRLFATYPVQVVFAVVAVLAMLATVGMVFKGHLPTHALLHSLQRLPAPIRHAIFVR
jgi:hypothetical protein